MGSSQIELRRCNGYKEIRAESSKAVTKENSMNEFSYFIKVRNFSIVSKIRELVSLKEVSLDLVKVRGHSDDLWNTRADILAKKGILARKDQVIVTLQGPKA
ncbi:35940_t:CDS:2, partial [Gigaspora margarita]